MSALNPDKNERIWGSAEVKDKRQHTGELYKDREKMRALMKGALETAKNRNADIEIAVAMGYCFGGAAVLE